MRNQAYLELQDVDLWLGPRLVFERLSLTMHRAEHAVILGPNGAGKSALIKLLSRELYPVVRAGSFLKIFGSTTVNLWELRRRIGLVSSDLQQLYRPAVPAADVVLSGFFGSVGIGRSQQATAAQRRRVGELMEQLQLGGLAERPFGQLSEGQRRRLLPARGAPTMDGLHSRRCALALLLLVRGEERVLFEELVVAELLALSSWPSW